MSDAPELLVAHGLSVVYGEVHANRNVSIAVAEKSVVGLIGANGAGKSTFIDALSGFTRLAEGTIVFDGSDITSERADIRARRGMVRTFQSLELFDDLTVEDNLALVVPAAPESLSTSIQGAFNGLRQGVSGEQVASALDRFGIEHLRDRLPSELPHGQRKLVALARTTVAEPKLLLLDEPAAGLDGAESRELGEVLRRLPEAGMAVLLIDHDMGVVLSVCDYIYVMDFGEIIAEGTPGEVRSDPVVLSAYLGEPIGAED